MITIVILYTELMPYNVIVIKALVDRECHVHVVLSDSNKKTPYLPPQLEGVTYYNRSSFWDPDHLFRLVKRLEPDLIWTAGWIDPLYNEVAGKVRKQLHIPVIASSDTQWRGGMQWFNVLVSRFRHRRWFSHLFVSGEPQVAYARKLGFRQEQILMHNLSADVELFHNVDLKMREKEYPRRLVFIGRFSKEKGLAYLLEAWNTIPDRKNWKLVLIGNGPDYPKLKGYPDVEIKDFESFEIENYPALKAVIKAEYNGETFEQTQVILDVAEYGCQSGYMYTITYTDYSGTLKEKIQDSIDSIDECNSLNIWRAYKNPEDAAAAKENGTYTIYGNVDKYKKKAVTATTYTYVTKSSRIKDVEELRKKFSITFKRRTEDENNEDDLNAVYESSGESTQTTIDMEMVERFKKQHGIE